MSARILIIEDDEAILSFLRRGLVHDGYVVDTATDGQSGLILARETPPDLVVLDWMLPGLDGLEVCRRLTQGGHVPILMLTAKKQEMDKVMGLNLGADDYMTKPFGVMELLARVKALLRRVQRTESRVAHLQMGDVEINFEMLIATRAGESIKLSTREFELLCYLAQNPGRVLSRQAILNRVWGMDYFGTDRTVDNFITRLRQKIEPNPGKPRYIQTIRGRGYRFVPAE